MAETAKQKMREAMRTPAHRAVAALREPAPATLSAFEVHTALAALDMLEQAVQRHGFDESNSLQLIEVVRRCISPAPETGEADGTPSDR